MCGNYFYDLPNDIIEKINITLTKMKQDEVNTQMKKQLRKKVYSLYIEKCQYVVADLEMCEKLISGFDEESRMIMYQVGENPDMYEYSLYEKKQSLERVANEYDLFLNSL